MKKKLLIIPFIFVLLLLFTVPAHAATGKMRSLSISTLSVTRNSQEAFYWLMCKNKLDGYSNSEENQHTYYSETLTDSQLNLLLDNAFGKSTDSDLNFFYFTGHTIFESINPVSGPLGINLNVNQATYYDFYDLAKKLNSYKGKMIVILDTCGSEAFIIDGVKKLKDQSRISVICSCGYLKESEFGYLYTNPYLWVKGYRYNGFTYALSKGLGFFDSDNMKADRNKNDSVSIQELYDYIKSYTFWYTQLQNNDTKMFTTNPSMEIFSNISIDMSTSSISLYKNTTSYLSVKVEGTTQKPSWSSSDSSVASVDSMGKVSAKKKGSAIITCKVGEKSAKCIVTVKEPVVVKLSLNKTRASVIAGSSTTLKATVSGTSNKVSWSSSNSRIAKVNSNGKVTGIKAGTATITATVSGVKAICRIDVKSTASNRKSKTYTYGFNINDSGRWTGKAFRDIKITPVSTSNIKITYHYLDGKRKDETYIAKKLSGNKYAYDPKTNHFYKGYKESISYYPQKGLVIFHGNEEGDSYYFEKLTSKEATAIKELRKKIDKGSWWSGGFKYSIGIFDNYVLVGNTHGEIIGVYGLASIQKTSYGYYIDIMGYDNYRWYKSEPHKLQCYSSINGTSGHKSSADFWMFGC